MRWFWLDLLSAGFRSLVLGDLTDELPEFLLIYLLLLTALFLLLLSSLDFLLLFVLSLEEERPDALRIIGGSQTVCLRLSGEGELYCLEVVLRLGLVSS